MFRSPAHPSSHPLTKYRSLYTTGSNGNPQRSDSLHYIRADVDNQYSLAIKSVGEIIQDYDSDNQFPCLGFGARIPPNGEVSHDFFLNLNPNSPYCAGNLIFKLRLLLSIFRRFKFKAVIHYV